MSKVVTESQITDDFLFSIGVKSIEQAIKKLGGVLKYQTERKNFATKNRLEASTLSKIRQETLKKRIDKPVNKLLHTANIESDSVLEVTKNGEIFHNGRHVIGQITNKDSKARRVGYNHNGQYKTIQNTHIIWNTFYPNDPVKDNECVIFLNSEIEKLFSINNLKNIKKIDFPKYNEINTTYRGEMDGIALSFYDKFSIEKVRMLVADLITKSHTNVELAKKYDTTEMGIVRAKQKIEKHGYLIKL